jgi:hypothetical protein
MMQDDENVPFSQRRPERFLLREFVPSAESEELVVGTELEARPARGDRAVVGYASLKGR